MVLSMGSLMVPAAFAADETADLAWITGHWCGGSATQRIEEHWLPPAGGQLLGLSRTLRGERVVMFEFLRIDVVDGVPTYFAQPGGRPATAFARAAGGADWVHFENPEHDFPQRIEYRRDGDALTAAIAGQTADGEARRIEFGYRRCAVPQAG